MVSEHKLELVNLKFAHTTASRPLQACRRLGPWLQHQRPDWKMLLLRLVLCPSIYGQGLWHIQTVVLWDFWSINTKNHRKTKHARKATGNNSRDPSSCTEWDLRLGWEKMTSTSTKHNQGLGETTPRSLRLSIFVPKLSAVHHLICKGLILLIVFVNCPNSNNNEKETQKLSNQS